ncbi:hypothetical protein GVAV_001267 [Gurleya vavrai]
MDERNEKLSTEFFTHFYVSFLLSNQPVDSLISRLTDDFFISCNIKRHDNLRDLCDYVICRFFDHYISYTPKIEIDDFCVFIIFDDFPMVKNVNKKYYKGFMRIFVEILEGMIKFINDDIKIEDLSNELGLKWKVCKIL